MKYILSIIILAIIITVSAVVAIKNQSPLTLGATVTSSFYTSNVSVDRGVTVGTSSTLVLATSTGRTYAVIVNDSANVVYLSLGHNATTTSGIRLNASGGSYEINNNNLFIGAINAVAPAGASVVTVTAAQ